MYRLPVRYEFIARAAAVMPCPVLANGHVYSAAQGLAVLQRTGARGLMVGRGAIRNPWLFAQIRQQWRGERPTLPTGRQVLEYVRDLWDAMAAPCVRESAQVQRMKKFTNYLGEGLEAAERFLHDIRRCETRSEFLRICEEHLDHDRPLALEPAEPPLRQSDATG
jgi:tRNA-dihydrouridine synthase